jgi:hypothetical protein
VTWVVSVKSSRMVQTFSPPLRSEMKTTDSPSGLNRGCASNASPSVIRVALPPVMGRV